MVSKVPQTALFLQLLVFLIINFESTEAITVFITAQAFLKLIVKVIIIFKAAI